MPKSAKPFWRKSKKAFYVRHAGRMLSLGPDKAEAERRWHELKAGAPAPLPSTCKTVAQLAVAFDGNAAIHYRKHGETTSEYDILGDVLKRFCALFGDVRLDSLSPRHLKQFQKRLVSDGLARTTVNAYCDRVRRVVKWAVSEEYVSVNVLMALKTVSGLQAGRTLARETEPVKPVPDARVDAILEHLPGPVRAMVEFMRWTGARPGEARIVRGCDLNMTGSVWEYRPARHKTEHKGIDRVVMIGERGQEALRPFLKTNLEAYVFSPDADGGRPYRRDSLRNSIVRACEVAFGMPEELRNIPKALKAVPEDQRLAERKRLLKLAREWRRENTWHPNQIRHNFATLARREFGVEAARVVLGHASVNVTERYAEKDWNAARAVLAKIG